MVRAVELKLWALASLVAGGGWRGRPRVGNLRWRHPPSAGEESWLLLLPEAAPEDTPEVRELSVEAALELAANTHQARK